MKVILLQDVARIGRRFEVKEVPTGHALNFLIPRKLAEPATPKSIKRVEELKKKKEHDTEETVAAFTDALKKLESETLEMQVEANEKGSLFKGINSSDIALLLKDKGFAIEESAVVLDTPIKELGSHTVTLQLGDVSGSATVSVVAKA